MSDRVSPPESVKEQGIERLIAPPDDDVSMKEKLEIREILRALVNHSGWKYIRAVLESQANQRYLSIGRSQASSIEEILGQAVMRGEANAMELLISMPDYLIGVIEAEMQARDIPIDSEESEDDDV